MLPLEPRRNPRPPGWRRAGVHGCRRASSLAGAASRQIADNKKTGPGNLPRPVEA